MRNIMSFWKFLLPLILLIGMSSCSGLREHIRQQQLETHGPPKGIKDYQAHGNSRTVKSNDHKNSDNQDVSDTKNTDRHNSSNSSAEVNKYSEKWDVNLPEDADAAFLKEIDTWLGTPYVYGGESKSGTDCSGMIQTIYKTIYGISLQRSANGMQKDVDFIPLSKAKLGDILFFKINFQTVGHVALYLGDRKFIHATVNRGVMISCLDELYYSKRYYKCGRIVAMQ